jgi:glycosyltransferase involved in cell wall biosynthesis
MTEPFFSVIIPTYNRANLLSKAIGSVIAQTFQNWELILVDDGSTDNTKETVMGYTKNDSRIIYLFQQNAERCAARNNGIRSATGKYICFLDSDDFYLSNRLQALYNTISDSNFPKVIFFTGLKTLSPTCERNIPVIFENGIKKFDLIATTTIHSQQICGDATILKAYTFDPRYRIGEDLELWLRINDTHPFFYIENQFTVVVVDHDDRSVNIKKYNSAEEQLLTLNHCFSSPHPGIGISPRIKKQLLSNCYFSIFKYWFYTKNRLNSLAYLIKSVLADPTNEQTKYKLNLCFRLIFFIPFNKIEKIM